MRSTVIALAGIIVLTAATESHAQAKPAALAGPALDRVILKGGTQLIGALLPAEESVVVLAVSREWLRTAAPEFFESQLERERQREQECLQTLRERIVAWQQQRDDSPQLSLFLEKELERIEKQLKGEGRPQAPPQFLLVEIPRSEVRRMETQPQPRRQIALLAWRERLADVERRSAADLLRELQERKVDLAAPVDLSDRLPTLPQDEKEWAARRAIVEFQYRRPVEFQGTGDLLVRTDAAGGKPPAAALMTQLLRSQLTANLTDLLEPAAVPKKTPDNRSATAAAEREGAIGVRITRVEQQLQRAQVSVETEFLAQLPGGRWERVWSFRESLDASRLRPDLEKQICQDPQVSQALDLARSLGLGATDDQVNLALRFGAATMEAQKQANEGFFEFRDRSLQHLDRPPLRWGTSP